jgi:O-methyltransferase
MTAATEMREAAPDDTRELFLDLLKGSLTHTLYAGPDAVGYPSRGPIRRSLLRYLRRRGIVPVRVLADGDRRRAEGRNWPLFAQTMVGLERLENLRTCIETVLGDGVPGDLIETGVWRGGASIYMRGVLKAHGVHERTVWVADSFRGLPPPDAEQYPEDAAARWHTADELAISVDEVKENFRRYGLLDDQVRFLEGWFRDTLPTVRDRQWALIRLDGDMYESTMDALGNLYPGLAPGGFVIVDDYSSVDACRQAVHDFRAAHDIDDPLVEVDWTGVYWRRSA